MQQFVTINKDPVKLASWQQTFNDRTNWETFTHQPMDSHHSIPPNLEILLDVLGNNVYSWRRYMCVCVGVGEHVWMHQIYTWRPGFHFVIVTNDLTSMILIERCPLVVMTTKL